MSGWVSFPNHGVQYQETHLLNDIATFSHINFISSSIILISHLPYLLHYFPVDSELGPGIGGTDKG